MPEPAGPPSATATASADGAPVAVVTGAGRGIGGHIAAALARAGYVVAGCSQSGRAEGPARDAGLALRSLDVTDGAAVAAFAADVLARHGRIDVLVNNAGVIDAEVPLEESDPAQWWRCVEVNVRGPYLMTRAVLPAMLAAGSGRVINLNSGAGVRPGEVATAYHVGKTALARLTGSTHLSGRGRGVVAFDLMPGVVRTDMTIAMRAHESRTDWTTPEQVCDLVLALADGRLDAWSGRFVRAGVDTVESLCAAAEAGLADDARTVGLTPYGPADPLG